MMLDKKGDEQLFIKEKAYTTLVNCMQVPPEMGGILIGSNSIIDTVVFDFGKKTNDRGIKYIPDIDFLNCCLAAFNEQGKDFLGMFHTHAYQWDSLSGADIQYIHIIMQSMPVEIECLYFPLVFPQRAVKPYKAKRQNDQIIIINEEIEII